MTTMQPPTPSDDQHPPVIYMQPPAARQNGFAVTALVTGIVGLCLSWVPVFDVLLGTVAIVFGALGWWQSSARGRGGFGLSIAGLICGVLTVLVFAVLLAALGGS